MGFNLSELAGDMNASQYLTITIVMTLSILVGIWLVPLIGKKLLTGVINLEKRDKKWAEIFQNSMFIGMISAFVGYVFCDVSKAGQGDLLAPAQGKGDRVDGGIQHPLGILLGHAGILGGHGDQFGFIHNRMPLFFSINGFLTYHIFC